MKKLIGIVIASLIFCNIGLAEMRLIEEKEIREGKTLNYAISTFCVDGYKFVTFTFAQSHMRGAGTNGSVVQFFKKMEDGWDSIPARC